jgi:iron complex transport system ATP-binding protein
LKLTGNYAYLTTTDLAIGYKKKTGESRLFNDLNLSLRSGQMVCFMGPNGAGKSSLLRTLAGLQKPLAGKIEILAHHPATEAMGKQIAVVLTDRIQAANLTVEEIVTFGRYPYLGWNIVLSDADKKIVASAIEQIQLQSFLDKKLYELSDGQLQMVMIARALAQDTPIILLDEPTAHLDLNNRVEIMDLLLRLSRNTGKAILVATHELDLALQTADLIWLTGKNQNIITGLPEDLVLKGTFDEIFAFKGFDLKTGRVQHQPFRKLSVKLSGDGPEYLWTKNALERNGFQVTQDAGIWIRILSSSSPLKWVVEKNGAEKHVNSIQALIDLL